MNAPSTSPRMLSSDRCSRARRSQALRPRSWRRAPPSVPRARPSTRAPASSRRRASTPRPACSPARWTRISTPACRSPARARSTVEPAVRYIRPLMTIGVTWRSRLPVSKSHACLQPGDVLPGDARQRRVALGAGVLSKRGPVARPSRRRLGRRPADRDRQQHGQNGRHPCVHGHGRVRLPQEDRREPTC